ncbi:MAG: type II toxin-antitoxin system VapC family toxin [Rhizobiaceae bacterium]|nr:MAG: type II toxin-antitoxin system VapC family toxin [Rhizobiaceae bacterium]CAG0985270.1 Ribonuclease VapC42 [Rhizobiaceae bacterium]
MIVETSAIVAILLDEPECPAFLEAIAVADSPSTTVVAAFEAALSAGRALDDRERAGRLVPRLLDEIGVTVAGIDANAYDDVLAAYLRYGKGSGHPAQLNFGDCFSYAAAKRKGVSLLFKGRDFALTDVGKA